MVLTSWLAAALLSAAPLSGNDEQGAGARRPLVLQRHSISALTHASVSPCAALNLLPLAQPNDANGGDGGEGELRSALETDYVIELVRTVVEPSGWENDGWRLESFDGGALVVVAPNDVQAKIGELLATLERDLLPSERLEVRLLPGGSAAFSSSSGLLVDRATADQRLAGKGALHLARVSLRDLQPVGGSFGETQEFTSQFDLQIAESAVTTTPRRSSWLRGLRLLARATRVDAGALVQLVVSAADPVAPTDATAFDAASTIALDSSLATRKAIGRLDQPHVGFVSFAGTVLLPEGKALWLPVSIHTASGEVECTLDLRCELGSSRPCAVIEPIARSEGEALRLSLRRALPSSLGRVQLGRLGITCSGLSDADPLFNRRFAGDQAPIARFGEAISAEGACAMASSMVQEVLDTDPWCQVGLLGSGLRTLLPPAASNVVTAALATLTGGDGGATIRARVRIGGELRGEFAVPAMVDQPLALWTGVNTLLVQGWDADVASNVAGPSPLTQSFLDGLALHLLLERGVRGELHLSVNAAAQLLTAPAALVSVGDASDLSVHQVRASVLAIDELVSLPARGGSVTLGGDVQLELEVIPN